MLLNTVCLLLMLVSVTVQGDSEPKMTDAERKEKMAKWCQTPTTTADEETFFTCQNEQMTPAMKEMAAKCSTETKVVMGSTAQSYKTILCGNDLGEQKKLMDLLTCMITKCGETKECDTMQSNLDKNCKKPSSLT